MRDIIPLVDGHLGPCADQAGFELVGTEQFEFRNGDVVHLAELRCNADGEYIVMLDICVMISLQTVAAEIWCPADLERTRIQKPLASVARYRRVWGYDQSTDPAALAQVIVREMSGWLEQTSPR